MGVAHLAQEHRVAQDVAQVARLLRRLRHPGESRELVDHPADITDLADDRIRALVEDGLVVLIDLLAVAALDALGGQLDRRQRVLDLMTTTTIMPPMTAKTRMSRPAVGAARRSN